MRTQPAAARCRPAVLGALAVAFVALACGPAGATAAPPAAPTSPPVSRPSAAVASAVSASAPAAAAAEAPDASGDIGWEGPSFQGASSSPSGSKPESKLWYAQGSWWADLWATASSGFYIHRLDLATHQWVQTPTQLEDRAGTRSDVLWDGTHLFVASHGFAEGSTSTPTGYPAELRRFSFSNGGYVLDAGFPVVINDAKSESLVIERDSQGRIWATWMEDAKIMVSVSSAGGTSFGAPTVLPVTGTSVKADDLSSILAFGGNQVGIMWSNQLDQKMYFTHRLDSDPVGSWSPTEVAYEGANAADDHINLKTVSDQGGRILAAVKTSKTGSSVLEHLLDRDPTTGVWTSHPFGTAVDAHTRSIVLVDKIHQTVHMFAAAGQSGGSVYEKTAPLSNITFPTGRGTAVLTDADSADINNPTSTKQSVDATTGLVVLATNDSTRRYWTHYDPLGGTTPPPPATAPGAPAAPTVAGGDGQVTVAWSAPASDGGAAITGYVVTPYIGAAAQPSVVRPAAPTSATLPATNGTTYTYKVAAVNSVGTGAASGSSASVTPHATIPTGPTGSVFVPIEPCRVVDTRKAGGAFGPGAQRSFQVGGGGSGFSAQGGKPGGCAIPDGATAVEASVTAVAPTHGGFLRAWPAGSSPPDATFLNFTTHQGVTNTGALALAAAGVEDLTLKSFGGPSHYVIDVQGYFATATALPSGVTGSVYVAIQPCRAVDTRQAGGGFGSGTVRSVQLAGSGPGFSAQGGKPGGCAVPDGATAVEASVTAVDPRGGGYLRTWPTGQAPPTATFLNFTEHRGITNTGALALAATGDDDLTLRSSGGPTHYVIDVQGYFTKPAGLPSGVTGSVFVPTSPCREVDTRVAGGAFAPGAVRSVQLAGTGGAFAAQGGQAGGCAIPDGATAVEASVTAVTPSRNGYLRTWPSGSAPPNATFLNFTAGQGVTNTGIVALAATGLRDLTLRSYGGPTHYVIDVQGYFTAASS
ncbi:fibronectin type III domain-containing protein [Aquihabitans sp. McL0605]|uniref:fibronectin type III domain-containing protein n=1 Tax=Aquihabitans sp. McL0605 TaxID=3415671 RepID=UPI003CF75182